MAYQFSLADRSVAESVRRIAGEEIDSGLKLLRSDAPLAERIHDGRKRIKKLRALIRLVRPHFANYPTENASLRAAGRSLAGLREAEVGRQTLAILAGGSDLAPDEVATLARPVEDRHADEAAHLAESLAAFEVALKTLGARAAKWEVDAKGFRALEEGLEDGWSRAQRAMKRALRHMDVEAVHDWRKRIKDHWYHARLLAPIWPEAMAPHIAAADALGEALGDYNDLAVLMADLAEGDGKARDKLVAEARARQQKLLAQTDPLARRLFAGPPDALADRWRIWWEVWRQDAG